MTVDDVVGVLSLEGESGLVFAVGIVVGEGDIIGGSVGRGGKRKGLGGRMLGLGAWGKVVEAFTRREKAMLGCKALRTASLMDL